MPNFHFRFFIFFLIALLANFSGCSKKDTSSSLKVLNLAISDDVRTSDPAIGNDVVSAELIENVYDGLLDFAYLGRPGQLVPSLAEALPLFKDKNKSVHFRLRKDVFFHDDPSFPEGKGRAFVAEDFIYSVKRIADPHTNSPNWWIFDGVIEGLNTWRELIHKAPEAERPKLYAQNISGLSAPNSTTLIIRLTRPNPLILPLLAMGVVSVVPHEAVTKYGPDFGNHPVGTGAFRLKEWVRGSKIILEKNPRFRKDFYPTVGSNEDRQSGLLKAATKTLPFVDEVHFSIIKEEQPRWLKFRNGELDVSVIPKDNYTEAISDSGELSAALTKNGISLHKSPSLTTWWIEFNLKDPTLGQNPKLRQALAHAFDRARALQLLYNGRGSLSAAPLPVFLEGGSTFKNKDPYPFDLNLAKKLLAEAGFAGGANLPELSFDLRGPGTTPRQLGELIKDNFEKIGVKVKVLANSFPEALEKQKTSRFQIMLGGWAADYPDPENYLQLFVSTNASPGTNSSNFMNKEYDTLYADIRTMLPGSARLKKIHRMVEILQKEAPCIFFFHGIDYRVSQSWLKNYHHHQLNYGIAKFLDIDPVLKAKTH